MFRVSSHRWWAGEGKPPKAPPIKHRTLISSGALAAFAEDRRGTIALPFAFMLTSMCLLTGAAVDIGMWMQARNDTIEAMDAGVLAGLKKYQDTTSASQAVTAAQLAYAANVTKRAVVQNDTINFQMINNNTQMQATGDAYLGMNFLKIAGIARLPLVKTDGSENSISMASVGTNAGTSLEVSIMIDNTGSMADTLGGSDTKMSTVITAANTLVDTVVWSDQSQYTSKVALIPFSEAVNLGSAATADAARGALKTTGGNGYTVTTTCGRSCTQTTTAAANVNTTPGWQGIYDSSALDDWNSSGKATFWASSMCVTERTGSHAYDDVSPATAPVGALYNEPVTKANAYSWRMSSNTLSTYSSSADWCPISATVMPLTNNKTALHAAINAMNANGGTAGHLGTAWAWYALSPNFNSLWPSAANAARPYSDLQVLNAKGQPVLKKIAILMTDGDYNTEYANGINDGYANANPTNDTSLNQARQLCTNMKAQGIEVYTIGAGVSSASQTFLQSCATDASHFYNATNTVALTAAFQSITQKLIQLHLTH